jgi:hypothetical protein
MRDLKRNAVERAHAVRIGLADTIEDEHPVTAPVKELSFVMAGLVPAISIRRARASLIETAGTSPAVTPSKWVYHPL